MIVKENKARVAQSFTFRRHTAARVHRAGGGLARFCGAQAVFIDRERWKRLLREAAFLRGRAQIAKI